MLSLPKNWFALEFFRTLRARVRGPLSKLRRRQCTLKARLPREVFEEMTSRLKEGDAVGLQWDEQGKVMPTRTTSSSLTFAYECRKPMATDRFVSLETADRKGVHAKEGRGAWKRGHGCAVLKLSDAARPGMMASVFSMIGGNMTIVYRQPRNWRAWPTLTLKFFVLTADFQGHLLFPTEWAPASKRLLVELARRKVAAFKADNSYPIREDFCDEPGHTSSTTVTDANYTALVQLPPPQAPLLLPPPQAPILLQ